MITRRAGCHAPYGLGTLTGRAFFPRLIAAPFHHGLVIVFATATALSVLAAIASLLRGPRAPAPVALREPGQASPPRSLRAPVRRRNGTPHPARPGAVTNPAPRGEPPPDVNPERGSTMTDPAQSSEGEGTALVVMDYQPGILGRLKDADGLVARAAQAISVCRRHGATIAYVRVAFADADYEAIPSSNRMAALVAGAGAAFHADSPTTAIDERIAPAPGDLVVRKTRVGAFSTTDLDRQLRQRGVRRLILAGVSTSGCLLSTVRDAADRDYELYVLSDASADPDPEVHAFLTERIFPRQATVVTVDELAALFAAP